MDTPGYIVLSRLAAQRRATDVLAANIANAGTPGFKASQAIFAQELTRQPGIDAPAGGQRLAFTQDRATWRNNAAGSLQHTGNPLDLALSGEGYFAVETPRGERFTRAGHFTLSPESLVVDPDGNPVLGEGGQPLRLPPGDVRIEVKGDGTIASETGQIGRLRVVRFEDRQQLLAEGNRLFAAPEGVEAQPDPAPRVVQGAVEESNVSPVAELTRLTAALREFQFAAQFIEKEGERLGSAVDRILKRR
ncbi:flagellar basal-body rod protein FlgF [Falsiroseomonas selenitidurans]|uniref:Flagellar basal-body rod protein FlgF n=1 Tax=Falsiroseomonas selenitidurans TaxID=2716335 RepID=A0ABX1E3N2_9PROT|nr:flagellar basal-body rod protein FlgF [Falsiroseomonas selenitidurans]NKC31691.1 flagellar basal-body rod protein FlgF [Falsiroseomonas selenitidurans]